LNEKQTTTKVLNGLFWKLMENGGAQGVQFLVSIILARLLSPEEYGVVGVILIFVTIANVLVQNGFSTALIQKRKVDDTDFSSVFFFSMAVSAVIYLVLYLSAPGIAYFYNNQEMTALVRVLAVVLFPGGVISIQNAYVSRNMAFKGLFISSFAASMISGAISIFLAYRGLGVWALVWQQIAYYFFYMLILFMSISWKPRLLFSILRIKTMFAFGWKLLCASLLDTVYNNIYGLVIGRIYNESMLGNYNRGEQFPKLIVSNLGAAIQSAGAARQPGRAGACKVHAAKGYHRQLLSGAAHDGRSHSRGPAHGAAAAGRKMAALCSVSANHVHCLFFLAHSHCQPSGAECNGAQRYIPKIGNCQKDGGPGGAGSRHTL